MVKKEEFFKDVVPNSIGPLEGLRVLEATTAVAGPLVGTLLADLGAENIKIEHPGTGDMTRRTGPFVESRSPLDSSSLFLSVNRNKKNITLNLKSPKGQALFKDLAKRMDILIENFKPGTLSGLKKSSGISWSFSLRNQQKIRRVMSLITLCAW